MKVSQKIISLVLVLTMAMGLATTPSFAAAENTEYENSLKSGWGSSTSNFQYPSAYNTSWNRQVINFIDLVATRTLNVYNTLGTTNSTLSDIKIRTGYIPTISDFLNGLKSNWGDSSSYFTVPSAYRGSWYGAALMLLDTIQQRLSEPLDFELDPTTSAILENISTNSGITANNTTSIVNKLSILDDNYIPSTLIQIIHRRQTGSTMFPNGVPYTSNYNPMNVTYVTANPDGQFRVDVAGTGAKRSIYTMLGYTNTNIVSLFSALQTLGTTYRVQKLDYSDGSPDFDEDGLGWNYTYSVADQLHYMNVNMASFFSRMGFALADDDTIAAKNANKPQEQNVLSNFTGSGSASASTADFTGVKESVSALKTSLSGGASYTQAFNILRGDSNGWMWFSNEVAESMDTTGNGNTRLRSVSDSTPYLDSYYDELSSYLGFSYNGGIE